MADYKCLFCSRYFYLYHLCIFSIVIFPCFVQLHETEDINTYLSDMLSGKVDLGLYNRFEYNWPDHRNNENKSMISAAGVMPASAADGLRAAIRVTQLAVTYC